MAAVTLPPVRVRLRLEEKVELSEEIWNPLGAVRVILAVRAVPLTVRDCEVEAVPVGVSKPVRLAGETVIVGAVGAAVGLSCTELCPVYKTLSPSE